MTVCNLIIGKIWLKDGQVLEFGWYDDFFAARAFHQVKGTIKWSIHSRWQ